MFDPNSFLTPISPAAACGGPMLTVAQVAEQLGVSKSLVYAEIQKGRLGAHQLARCLRISQDQFQTYLEENVTKKLSGENADRTRSDER